MIARRFLQKRLELALLAVVASGPAVFGGDAPDDRVLWRFEFASDLPGLFVTALDDGTIYATDSTALYALTAQGDPIWTLPGAGGGGPIPVADDGTLYTGLNGVKAINPDGTIKWQYVPPDNLPLLAGPSIGPDGNIYAVQDRILSLNEGLGAFSLDPAGNLRWSNIGEPEIFNTDGGTTSEIVFSQDAMFVGLGQAAVRAFLLSDGDQLWHSGTLGVAATTPPRQLPDGRLVFRTGQTGLLALNTDGSESWSAVHPESVSILTQPAVGPDGRVYVGDWLGLQLWSVSSDGVTQFVGETTSDTLNMLAVSPDNQSLFATGGGSFGEDGWVRRYDPADASLQWQIDLPRENNLMQYVTSIRPEFTADGSTVYFTTRFAGLIGHSYLYALNLSDQPAATPGDVNGDGTVDVLDLFRLLSVWGSCGTECPEDLTGDGLVDVSDLFELLGNWG